MSIDGILNVSKPAGWTSHDVVSRLRRILGEKRIGHAGTLDPIATGVLVVCIGQATRIVDYLMGAPKQYRATVRLGLTTATDDVEGEVLATADASSITRDAVERLLPQFLGRIRQRPPAYSALKIGGRPMYALARRGLAPVAREREVEVYGLELTGWRPPECELLVDCGRGTYIRSLARDIGEALGVGGCIAALERTRVGRYELSDALEIESIAALAVVGAVARAVRPVDEALSDLPAAWVDAEGERRITNGAPSPANRLSFADGGFLGGHAPMASDGAAPSRGADVAAPVSALTAERRARCRVYSSEGRLIAIADPDPDWRTLHPTITFRDLAPTPAGQRVTWE